MFDLTKYYGSSEDKPKWNPSCEDFQCSTTDSLNDNAIFILDGVLNYNDCFNLINQFEDQNLHPVGVNGYLAKDSKIGSFRANAWAIDLAEKISPAFSLLPSILSSNGRDFCSDTCCFESPFKPLPFYKRLGPTPFMRFMRYSNGGKHTPHYDAPYLNTEEHFITLFSWVLYLNDVLDEHGGKFQFVYDGNRNHTLYRNKESFNDWLEMANENIIIKSIQPKCGRLLLFPHWFCHQVQEYTGNNYRYIIRGDLAYGFE